jgi:glycosyltransferase involved in cell wall biosynthesis
MTRRLRIAIVSAYFAPHIGGADNQNRLIGEALVRRGHYVTILTRRFDRRLPAREMLAGLDIRRLRPSGRGVLGKWLMNIGTAWHLVCARPGYDLVFVTQISPHALGPALASCMRHLAIVLRPIEHGELAGDISDLTLVHVPVAIRGLLRGVLDGARRWAYRRARRVIVTSSALAREAQAFGFPPVALVPIPNAIDTKRFRPPAAEERDALRRALGLPADAGVVVWVGRLVHKKGLETLVEAWAAVVRARPRARLLIVGAGAGAGHPHDAEEALRAAISEYGLQASVVLTGAVPDVERYLRASDLFVFTSEEEGFGVALVEAMACGLPVVTSRIEGAAADFVDDGQEGLKFTVGDARQLRECMVTLLADATTRRRMGAAGRARVEEALDVQPVAAAYERLFAAVTGDTAREVRADGRNATRANA